MDKCCYNTLEECAKCAVIKVKDDTPVHIFVDTEEDKERLIELIGERTNEISNFKLLSIHIYVMELVNFYK